MLQTEVLFHRGSYADMDINTTVLGTAFTCGVADDRVQFTLATDVDD